MKIPRIRSLIPAITFLWLTACNDASEGGGWYRDHGSENSATYLRAVGLILSPSMLLGGERRLGAEPRGGRLEASEPRSTNSKDEASEGLKSPRWGVGDAAGALATLLRSGDAGGSKLPPPHGLTFVDITPASFPFMITVLDDGKGKAGGWQVAPVTLEFKKILIPTSVITWWCRFKIEMPLRTEKVGRVDVDRAIKLSLEITRPVAYAMDYSLPNGIFCSQFVVAVRAAFDSKYPGLGSRVMM